MISDGFLKIHNTAILQICSFSVDDLLLLLSKAGVGCFIGPNFVGALAYVDDIVLLAPNLTALRRLLAICENYAQDYCISFNSLKKKRLDAILKERRNISVYVENLLFVIDDEPISIVKIFFASWSFDKFRFE
jgi:hypothetical protein